MSSGRAARRRHDDALVQFAADLHRNVLRPLWGFRLELLLVGVVAGSHAALSGEMGDAPAAVLVGWLAGAVVVLPPARRALLRCLHAAQVRRRWTRAVRDAGLATADDQIPRACKVGAIPSGDLLAVQVPRGSSVPELEQHAGWSPRPWVFERLGFIVTRRPPPGPMSCLCGGTRSRPRSRFGGRTLTRRRCRCGSRSRSDSTRTDGG